ncbi:tyrosine decarboxylase [Abeliophyllum distichum]|uniref:Tyrosine decarboxylase n=1 Tax=Abeliophyllum distichum TaxID=126358 RepID=A0ABD1PE69_9LAMI
MVIDFLADYYKNVEKYPVRSQVEPGYLQKRLPELEERYSFGVSWRNAQHWIQCFGCQPDVVACCNGAGEHPNEFFFFFLGGDGGVMQGTTCEVILCAVVAARDQMLKKIGRVTLTNLWCLDPVKATLHCKRQLAQIAEF